jgi:hypothetical protein
MLILLMTSIRAAVRALPLTLLALGLAVATVVAIARPTPQRRAMVDQLSRAIISLSAVIAGQGPVIGETHPTDGPRLR